MALKDKIAFGMSLPHRSPDPIDMADGASRSRTRAEALGFRDLWVTENSLDHVNCFDPVVILTYAAAVTTKIRVGCSVVVLQIHSPLMVAHQWALPRLCQRRPRDPRGRHRPRAPLPAVRGAARGPRQALPRGEWRSSRRCGPRRRSPTTAASISLEGRDDVAEAGAEAAPADLDGGRPPGRGAPRRALADGWMGSGGSRIADFAASVPILKRGAGSERPRPGELPDLEAHLHGGRRAARRSRGASSCAGSPMSTATRPAPILCGIHGTPEQVRERLEEMVGMGANHLLLNPVSRYTEQVEALAEVGGAEMSAPRSTRSKRRSRRIGTAARRISTRISATASAAPPSAPPGTASSIS